jgi:hypothetical protein
MQGARGQCAACTGAVKTGQSWVKVGSKLSKGSRECGSGRRRAGPAPGSGGPGGADGSRGWAGGARQHLRESSVWRIGPAGLLARTGWSGAGRRACLRSTVSRRLNPAPPPHTHTQTHLFDVLVVCVVAHPHQQLWVLCYQLYNILLLVGRLVGVDLRQLGHDLPGLRVFQGRGCCCKRKGEGPSRRLGVAAPARLPRTFLAAGPTEGVVRRRGSRETMLMTSAPGEGRGASEAGAGRAALLQRLAGARRRRLGPSGGGPPSSSPRRRRRPTGQRLFQRCQLLLEALGVRLEQGHAAVVGGRRDGVPRRGGPEPGRERLQAGP